MDPRTSKEKVTEFIDLDEVASQSPESSSDDYFYDFNNYCSDFNFTNHTSSNRDEAGSKNDGTKEYAGFDNVGTSCEERTSSNNFSSVSSNTFSTVDDAYTFYNKYAKIKGFSIRKSKQNGTKGDKSVLTSKKLCCSKAGYREPKHFDRVDRKREARQITRTGCPAMLSIKLDRNTDCYVVSKFVDEHNHPMIGNGGVSFLRSHRKMTNADKYLSNALHSIGMRGSHIMDFNMQQSGGYDNVGFTSKDMFNHLDRENRRNMEDGDAEAAIYYFVGKQEADQMFFYKYTVDEQGRLHNMFWTDSSSRSDFNSFGDVLIFDTTYRTNAYNKPLVILQGVNNNFNTIIFGCALLADETTETYTWVLNTLMEAMDGRTPQSVITDGDLAMRRAIIDTFPDARRRLCRWHLKKNAISNVHSNDFQELFRRCMEMESTETEFEEAWHQGLERLGIGHNHWINEIYEMRHLWAECYLRGQFFAYATSTQRCEGMNAYMNRFLNRRKRLFNLVRDYDRAVNRLRVHEAKEITDGINSKPVLSTGIRSIEKHASEIYTKKLFYKFRESIRKEQLLFVADKVQIERMAVYYVSMYTLPNKRWTVNYYSDVKKLNCSCLMFETTGIPCSHMVSVMKLEHLTSIPESCILPRWTKVAKYHPIQLPNFITEAETQRTRCGTLKSMAELMCFYASHDPTGSRNLQEQIREMTIQMKMLYYDKAEKEKDKFTAEGNFGVKDPPMVRTKGMRASTAKKSRKCSLCSGFGHTKRTCNKLKANKLGMVPEDIENEDAPSSQYGYAERDFYASYSESQAKSGSSAYNFTTDSTVGEGSEMFVHSTLSSDMRSDYTTEWWD